jgi:Sulfotransferase family
MPAAVLAANPELAGLPPPIIVLGTRPGATALIGAMIGRNPGAFEFPQLNLFLADTLEAMLKTVSLRNHTQGLLRALAYIYGSEQTIISVGMARRWVLRHLSWSTSRVFDELRTRLAPRRLVDKSAVYSQNTKCLERVRKAAPDAYYVHVVEHPLTPGAVTAPFEGLLKRPSGADISKDDQVRWVSAQRQISEALKDVAPERLVVLHLERLLADPRAELSGLCARLDLPNDETALAEMLHPENSPFACLGPVGANLGDDPAFLRDPAFPPKGILGAPAAQGSKAMLPEVAQFAAQYGYE